MNVDKELFKEYINQKYPEKYHITEIEEISVMDVRYTVNQFDKSFSFYEEVKKNGYIVIKMIKPTWSGWKIVEEKFISKANIDQIGTWRRVDKRDGNRFNYTSYMEWVRDSKLRKLGI